MAPNALDLARAPRPTDVPTRAHADLLQSLALHRGLLLVTADGLSEEQARLTPTVSALSLGGLVKHVDATERAWTRFIEEGAAAMYPPDAADTWTDGFRLTEDETLAGVVDAYRTTAARTGDLVRSIEDLDAEHPLPPAPWFEPGGCWSARRVLLHLIAETAQHAGHADLLRETIDGQRTMG